MSALNLIPVLAFLLGSVPFGYLLYRLSTGRDIRQAGSGNIGATNVMRTAGKKMGLLTLALDAAKGYAAVEIARHMAPGHAVLLAATLLAAILGHLYSPWLRFRGGKGVATGLGAFLAIAAVPLLLAAAIFVIVLALTRYVSLASICACTALPALLWTGWGGARPSVPVEMAAIIAAALIIARHHANIGRLLAGTESRFGSKGAGTTSSGATGSAA